MEFPSEKFLEIFFQPNEVLNYVFKTAAETLRALRTSHVRKI